MKVLQLKIVYGLILSLETALKDNYIPNNDLYLIFGANEEVYGDSQYNIVMEMKKQELYIPLIKKSLKFYLLHLKQYPPTY